MGGGEAIVAEFVHDRWQTAINAVVALELLARGTWSGTGILGPEAFNAKPFLDLLAAPAPDGYGSPWGIQEKPVG